ASRAYPAAPAHSQLLLTHQFPIFQCFKANNHKYSQCFTSGVKLSCFVQ
ncbi:hypothetical protein Nmel_005271, partial [Mimus melanotis]